MTKAIIKNYILYIIFFTKKERERERERKEKNKKDILIARFLFQYSFDKLQCNLLPFNRGTDMLIMFSDLSIIIQK